MFLDLISLSRSAAAFQGGETDGGGPESRADFAGRSARSPQSHPARAAKLTLCAPRQPAASFTACRSSAGSARTGEWSGAITADSLLLPSPAARRRIVHLRHPTFGILVEHSVASVEVGMQPCRSQGADGGGTATATWGAVFTRGVAGMAPPIAEVNRHPVRWLWLGGIRLRLRFRGCDAGCR